MNRQQKLQCTDAGNIRIKIKKKMIKIQKGKIYKFNSVKLFQGNQSDSLPG